ncbi:MAG: Sec-independent protein translocase subunit TatA [Nocardioides sp.]
MPLPLIGDLGTPELLIIFAVVILLFGASKLPELARGSGRALRIFKAETKGLSDEDDDAQKTTVQLELEARQAAEREAAATRPVEPPVEHHDDTA